MLDAYCHFCALHPWSMLFVAASYLVDYCRATSSTYRESTSTLGSATIYSCTLYTGIPYLSFVQSLSYYSQQFGSS